MVETRSYKIITNEKGRRILVVVSMSDMVNMPEFDDDSFDAMFFDTPYGTTYEANYETIIAIHPILSDKCSYKPLFVSDKLRGKLRLLEYLIDGFAFTPLEPQVTCIIEEIYENIAGMNMLNTDNDNYSIAYRYLLRECKYLISRNRLFITPVLTNIGAIGYDSPFSGILERQELVTPSDRRKFYNRLLEARYIDQKRFIDRLHVCPDCGHSHLLFIEVCPNCKSSDISEEAVLHHFRCANISPETTYIYEGQLRCPKCSHFLRHIGVDYDRPANLFTCHSCKNFFTSPSMKVICTYCKNAFSTSQLIPFNIYEYEFTVSGIEAIRQGNLIL